MRALALVIIGLLGCAGPLEAQWDRPLAEAVQDRVVKTGVAVGAKIPPFRLQDQDGRWLDLDAIKGPHGAVLLFHRSADW